MSLQLCVSERYSFWISSQFWSQVRALVCSPEPHVKLQLDQLFQDEKTKNKLSFLISKYWINNTKIVRYELRIKIFEEKIL